jgi:hypothetical protein
MNNTAKRELPANWASIVEDSLAESIGEWVVVRDCIPLYNKAQNDWVVSIKCIKSDDTLRDYDINDGDLIGYAFYHRIFL